MLVCLGVGGLGAVFGWHLYHVDRWQQDTVQISDLATVATALAGSGLMALFQNKEALLDVYGLGLTISYFIILWQLVGRLTTATTDWFLTGRLTDARDQRPLTD